MRMRHTQLLRIKIQSHHVCETKPLSGLLDALMLVSIRGIVSVDVELWWLECAVMCQPFCGKLYMEFDSKSVGVFD